MERSTTRDDNRQPPQRERLPLAPIVLALLLPLQAGCSLFGIRTAEEAEYALIERDGRFELREYAPRIVAETRVDAGFDEAGNTAFRRLFAYISGANVAGREIAMTAPVVAGQDLAGAATEIDMTAPVIGEADERGWRFAFVLPSTFTADTAPQPTDATVRLAAEPRRTVAAVRYSGRWLERSYRRELAGLEDWMRARGLEAASTARVLAYDPPWTLPFLRRNEITIDIDL